jgi:hypothetical protein
MPKARRTDLHARSFQYLRELGTENRILADHAFHGSLFSNAASLYRLLGAEAFNARDYRSAARYFSSVSECSARDPQVSPLDPADSIQLARADTGEQSLAVAILIGA